MNLGTVGSCFQAVQRERTVEARLHTASAAYPSLNYAEAAVEQSGSRSSAIWLWDRQQIAMKSTRERHVGRLGTSTRLLKLKALRRT